jgi:hypothetical protein
LPSRYGRAADGDWDYPDELAILFIINAVTGKRMLETAAAKYDSESPRSAF